MLNPGEVLGGDYEIQRPLGGGGMGAVYLARQRSTDALRALKIMLPQWLQHPELVQRFEQEARACGRIESEHVVKILAYGVDAEHGMPWLAMEYLLGETLDQRMAHLGVPEPSDLVEILEQFFHGLGAAHRAGIVHRDLKPQNLYIAKPTRVGVPFTVKILDFGIAKVLSPTRPGTLAMGTRAWMAPEQERAGSVITPAADLWAVGLIVFWLLTGRHFWLAIDAADSALSYEIYFQPIPTASERLRQLGLTLRAGPAFDTWLSSCLQREPAARFQTVEACWRALEPALQEIEWSPRTARVPLTENLTTAPLVSTGLGPSQPSAQRAPVRSRHRLWFGAVGTLAVLVAGAVVVRPLLLTEEPALSAAPSPALDAPELSPSERTAPVNSEPPPGSPDGVFTTGIDGDSPWHQVRPPTSTREFSGTIDAGRTPNGKHWLDQFRYATPKQHSGGRPFVEARDACVAEGLSLCSREQLDRICAEDPTVGSLETWTTSFVGNGQLWTRGGSSCEQQSAADPTDAKESRGGLCCERKPAIEVSTQRKGDPLQKALSTYVLTVQAAMNSRDPEQVLQLAAPEFFLYSQKRRWDHERGAKAMTFDLGSGTEFDNHLVRCGGVIEGAGKHGGFVCQTVIVRKMNDKPKRDLAFMDLQFRFIPPDLKYDFWAVGTNIVRNFTPIDTQSNTTNPAGASDGLLTPKAARLLTSAAQ